MFRLPIIIDCALRRRSSLYLRSEIMYLMPALKGIEKRRQCMLDALERSHHESGAPKQYSGFGSAAVMNRWSVRPDVSMPHIFNVYKEVDDKFADAMSMASQDTFPVKRLYNICQLYSNVWSSSLDKSSRGRKSDSTKGDVSDARGPFPYVDDRATVLGELTKNHILQTRHRVNSDSHPKWALRTIRRRRRKLLVKMKRRSISQEATRELQARLIANKTASKKSS